MAEGAQMRIRALGRDAILSELRNVGSDTAGLKIMQKKSEILAFRISELKFSACMILKQEALSANAEFATPKECILGHEESYDGVLFGRPSDLLSVAKKCLIQPFGLKELGGRIQEYVSKRPAFLKPSIMAVVNITPDSFYKDSRMELSRAIEHIEWLIQRGVEIIDIGGASSRPGSDLIDDEDFVKITGKQKISIIPDKMQISIIINSGVIPGYLCGIRNNFSVCSAFRFFCNNSSRHGTERLSKSRPTGTAMPITRRSRTNSPKIRSRHPKYWNSWRPLISTARKKALSKDITTVPTFSPSDNARVCKSAERPNHYSS